MMRLRERGVTESMIDTGRQPMGLSWSAMRKVLEDENICDSLKGRVQYFVTRYRESLVHVSHSAHTAGHTSRHGLLLLGLVGDDIKGRDGFFNMNCDASTAFL